MSDILLVVIIVSVILGIKWPLLGSIAGAIIAGGMYYLLNNPFEIKDFAFHIFLGLFVGYLSPLAVRWLLSGLRGGRGKTIPGVSLIGGFGGSGRPYPGGIISNEDERGVHLSPEKQKEQFIIKLIRILVFPLIFLLVLVGLMLI